MMKSKYWIYGILIFVLLVGISFVNAQETEETEGEEEVKALPEAGICPDSWLYGFKRFFEGVGMFFTFDDLAKVEKHVNYAGLRLSEAKAMAEIGKPEFVDSLVKKYEDNIKASNEIAKKAQQIGKNVTKVTEMIGFATSVHLEVLAEVYEKVPEQAKPAIEKAMIVSVKGHEKAVEVLKTKDALGEVPENVSLPTEVPKEVRERIQVKAQEELEKEKMTELLQKDFESFEALEAFCLEGGGAPEVCASIETKCKEMGATTPNECARAMMTAIITIKIAKDIRNMSAEDCEEMDDINRKEWCYSGVAKFTEDASLCEKITDVGRKRNCYWELGIYTKDASACEGITDSRNRDVCYWDIAIEINDTDLCEKISISDYKRRCYTSIALKIADSSLCEKITYNVDKHICYALVTDDDSMCEKITDSANKDWCYGGVAEETKDASLCEKITDSAKKDSCYSTIAMRTGDASLCEEITDSSIKEGCYELVHKLVQRE